VDARVTLARSEFKLGTKPLIAALMGVALGASPIPFNSIGLVIGPVTKEYGWSVEQVANGITIFGVVAALLAPLYGAFADRIGARKVALCSLAAFIATFSLLYFTPADVRVWYAFWALISLFGIGSTPVTWSRGISQWFSKNRGSALGIMLMGTSLTAIVLPKLGTAIIAEWGWRALFPSLGLLSLLIAMPLAYFWFREPSPEERPQELSDSAGNLLGLSTADTLKSYRFWIMVISTIMVSTAYGGAHVHMMQIVQKHGFTVSDAAGVASIVGTGILIGRVVVGLLFDRFWAPAVAFPVLVLPAISCYLLMGTGNDLMPLQLAALMLGLAAGAESDVIAFMAARYFGMANYGKIFGLIYLFFGLCAGVSPKLYARAVDQTGSYDSMLQTAIILFCVGGALLLLLGRYPDLSKQSSQAAKD
jgi:MFS transporter, OFA family, oxalate/formate antiporter